MKKMSSMKKRMFSAFLAMTMIIGLVPTVVFAAEESVTLTASYNDTSYTSGQTITAVDENIITLSVVVKKIEETAGDTLEIVIPYGVELLSAPGVTVNTTTSTVTSKTEFSSDYSGYFVNADTSVAAEWSQNTTLKNATNGEAIANASGTLTYNLFTTDSISFAMTVKVNSYFVPLGEDATLTTVLGDITATLKDSTTVTMATESVNIQAEAQADGLQFGYFSVEEYASDSLDLLGSKVKTNLVPNNVNTVKLSTAIEIDTPFDGVDTSRYAVYPSFTLTVPAGSAVEPGGTSYKAVKDETETDTTTDQWTITINSTKQGVTTSSNQINMSDFVIVTLPDAPSELKVGDTYTFAVSNLVFPMRNVYSASTAEFVVQKYYSDDTENTSISVVEFAPEYGVTYLTHLDRRYTYNNYYDSTDDTKDTYAEYIDGVIDQTLMTFRRAFKTAGTATTDGSISITPVKMSFMAEKVAYDTTDPSKTAYLDFVNSINFNVPFIGSDAPRQSSELLALTIITENYGTATESDIYTTNATEKPYTFTQDEIDAFMAAVDNAEGDYIGSYNNWGTGIDLGDTDGTDGNEDREHLVEYHWSSTSKVPTFQIKAPEGESIIGVIAEFSGDTDSFTCTSTSYDYKVFGYPKSYEITYTGQVETGVTSKYTYTVEQDSDNNGTYDTVAMTDWSGFLWASPVSFDLTVEDTSSSLVYMYNTAEANYQQAPTEGLGLKGYQNLGSIEVNNKTGALPKTSFTISADIDTTNDVVKEIYFPYVSDEVATTEVVGFTYTLIDDTTGNEGEETTELLPYTLASTYGIVEAPEGQSFSEFSVTLSGWTSKTTTSIFELRGYLKDSNELTTGDVKDSHLLKVITEATDTDTYTGTTTFTTFTTNTTSHADMRVLGTTDVAITAGTVPVETTLLLPGVDTNVEFMLFGGEYGVTYNSAWHDIVFTVVLPSSVSVNDISVGDFKLEHAISATDVIQLDTGETVSGVELIDNTGENDYITLNADACKAYYGADTTITEARVYKYKISDEDVNLYWTRYEVSSNSFGSYDTHANFTVSMNVTANIDAATAVIPWSQVLILGTSDSKITDFNDVTAKKGSVYDGEIVTNYSGDLSDLQTGVTTDVVVGSSSMYLYIDQEPMVVVQDAYVTKSNDETHYYEDDEATFTSGGTGTLHFSVIDTVADTRSDAASDVNYVLFPLPTVKTTNALQGVAEFAVTPGVLTVTLPNGDAVTSVEKYVTLDADTKIEELTATSIKTLYDASTANATYSSTNGHNALVLAITNQSQFSTIQVSLGFTVPSYNTESAEYVKLSGMTSYLDNNGSRARYYGGYAPESAADGSVGENYVYFAYHYPEWDITYKAVLDNENTDDVTVDVTFTDTTPTAKVNDNSELAVPTATPDAITGYTVATDTIWYTDEALTTAYSATAITADTTLYARYEEKSYTVAFAYGYTGAPTVPDPATAYYTGTIALPTEDTRTGYTFDGWYYGDTKVTADTVYNTLDAEGDDDVVLTAKYDATDYTVVYHLNYTDATDAPGNSTFAWDEALAFETATRAGYTLAGWAKSADAAAEDVIDTTATYGIVFTDETDTEVEVYAVWTAKTYTVAFDLAGEGDVTAPVSIDSITIGWADAFDTKLPADPVRAGYTFGGWYYNTTHITSTDVYGTDIGVDDLEDENTPDATLTAHWTENTSYTLTFDDQIANTSNDTDTMAWTEEVSLPTAPTQTGYTFDGWYTDAECTGTAVSTGDTFASIAGTTDDDATIYAKWIENTYTLVFDDGTGTIDTTGADFEKEFSDNSVIVTWNETITLPTATPATGDADTHSFVHWDYNDGNAENHNHPTQTTGTFADLIGVYLTDTDLDDDSEITLTAHYVEHAVTFNYYIPFTTENVYTEDEEKWKSVTIDATDVIPQDSYSVDGYTFTGWTDGSYGTIETNETPEVYYGNDTEKYADNVTNDLTASYTENQYTITYDLNYTGATTAEDVTYTWNQPSGDAFSLPAPTRAGYTFTGWYRTNTDGTLSNKVTEGDAYSDTYGTAFGMDATNTGTVYAGWTAKTYTVTYRRNYADAPADGKIAEVTLGWDGTLSAPTAPTRTGYTFLGWDKSSTATTATYGTEFSNKYSWMAGTENEDESGFTLYGVWKVNTYTVTYDVGEDSESVVAGTEGEEDENEVSVAYNETFTLTTLKPTIVGQTFDAWYKEAGFTNKLSIGGLYSELFGAANMTLYANYTTNEYEITFTNLDGGDVIKTGAWNDVIGAPTPTKDDYTFAHWHYVGKTLEMDSTSTFANVFDDVFNADTPVEMTLIAYWKEGAPDGVVNYSAETLTGLIAGGTYTITVDGHAHTMVADADGAIALALSDDDDSTTDYDWFGHTISIVKEAVDYYTEDSDVETIKLVARPADPTSSLSTNTAETAYDGAQIFTLKCTTANTNIHYDIYESDGYSLVDGGTYNTDSAYAMKETSDLEIYAVIADGTEGAGLKSATVNYMYYIAENLSVDTGDFDSGTAIISSVDNADYATLVATATAQDFGLIKIDDIVTDVEEEILLGAIPSGYTEEVEFHLHATIDDEIIYSTVDLATEVTVDIVLDEYDSSKTYQVLHMKHDGDHVDDVEIFSEEKGNLIVFPETKTLRITGLTSLSPFMVVSKSASSSNFRLASETVSAALETFEHVAYMQGYSDGTFAPDADITRAQAVVMLSRLLTEQMDMTKTYTSNFSDVTADLWYANAVGYMENLGIITGYTDGTFRGDNPISRAEFAVIACRFDQLELSGINPFSDVADDYWAVDYISAASEEGWVLGYSDGTFRPSQNITRAQAVTMVNRVLDRSCDVSFVEDHLDDLTTYTDVDEAYWAYDQILEATNTHTYTQDDEEENWTSIG